MSGSRRSYGSGSLAVRVNSAGAESWYGKWRDVSGRQHKRVLGPKRQPGSRDGLTRKQAEIELRRAMEEVPQARKTVERVDVALAGRRLLEHLAALGRKRSTLEGYECMLRVHLAPFFGPLPLEQVGAEDVERYIALKRNGGASVKSILNALGLLHAIFEFAARRGWATANPCKRVDKPQPEVSDPDVRFLDQVELDALLRAVPEDHLGRVERVLYMAAAMTGMRQGECLGLRWRDVDWAAARVRVRQSFVRGEYGTPKSKRSSRSVPLADPLATELERLWRASAYQADDDLVFCHPHTGHPLDRSRVLKRFKRALRSAAVREVRFHDLRHTFGTRMAAAGVPLRTIQEWMGHRDSKTTLIYADYAPSEHEAEWIAQAFAGAN